MFGRITTGVVPMGKKPKVTKLGRIEGEDARKILTITRRVSGGEILDDMPEAILEGNFMNRLRPEIRAEVHLMKPKGLGQIMEMALRIKDKNITLKGYLVRTGPFKQKSPIYPQQHPTSTFFPLHLPKFQNQGRPRAFSTRKLLNLPFKRTGSNTGFLRTVTTYYGVIMETGMVVQGVGVFNGVLLEIQSVKIKEDFLPLELGSSDVILGMKWMANLRGTQMN
ncbi:Transposon Tf2-1 polyprotein [Abeliophyllum distichum]|uniref:Transposon Tf2-1 polyprotein n=1 Tax=Abeliophyllum distichum TaxID=126358 RepID=A0ABD1VZ00_9LAMI